MRKLLRRPIEAVDTLLHVLKLHVCLVCDLYDWSLGLPWSQARSGPSEPLS